MSNIIPFQFEDNEIRTIKDIEGLPWFVAKDVATVLGYVNTSDAISKHCKGVANYHPLETSGGKQNVRIIAEPDLYRLIVKSELPAAEKFEAWIFEEVLPAVRKTGGYSIQRNNPESLGPISKGFKDAIAIAKAAGLKGNAAVVAANTTMIRSFGIDILELLDIKGAISDDSQFNKDCEIFKAAVKAAIKSGKPKPTFGILTSRRVALKNWSEEYAENVIAALEKRGEIITKPGRISTQYFLA